MKKSEARTTLKKYGASQLNSAQIAIAGQLLESAFIHRSRVETTDVETVDVPTSIQALADKTGLAINTVQKHLAVLIEKNLVNVTQESATRKTYRIDFSPMLTWELTKTVRTRDVRERRKSNADRMRDYRANKAIQQREGQTFEHYDGFDDIAPIDCVRPSAPYHRAEQKADHAPEPFPLMNVDNFLESVCWEAVAAEPVPLSPADLRKVWEETPSTEKELKQQRLHEWANAIEGAKAATVAQSARAN